MKKTTGELLEILKKETSWDHYIESASESLIKQTPLSVCLNALIKEKGLKKSKVINQSGLDRGYAYQIFDGLRQPNRDRVLALCLSMNLTPEETQQLLKQTGYAPLYARLKQDSVILFCLQHSLSILDANELLYEMSEPLLSLGN